ncbi:hypothetical protein FAZ78_07275 [Cereibacter changlensis]|uniref:Uncharacterized protein n=1 Tax=Cereibacter changlensis TaxID=402884 RepID=A0A4V5NM36_9RHOB|nr:hypothetical protein [Cereibacter changlensis]TKA97227.1 hypothetical protein FAZ78_07275 [Cereibacter changlensis]
MTEDVLVVADRKPFGWYEEVLPVRGCVLSLEDIREVYRDLLAINRKYGEQIVATLQRDPDITNEQWEARKAFLLDNAFCLTITVNGLRDQQLYGESAAVLADPNLPKPIKSIFFTNVNSFQRNANGSEPANRIEVLLDFGKPELFDPNPLVSAATPNESSIRVHAQDITFFSAVQKVVEKRITSKKAWYGAIHRNFAYDIGVWLFALPVALYFSAYYMNIILPLGGRFELFRWPLFVYLVGLMLLLYRALMAYAKWAFPVNVLEENKDRALKHRLTLGGFASWLFYKVASTAYGIIIS